MANITSKPVVQPWERSSQSIMQTFTFTNSYTVYFPKIQGPKPLFLQQYIDDLFFIWPHDSISLLTFKELLNQAHNSIHFELNFSSSEIPFLDTLVYKEDGRLQTRLYKKPTDRQQFLHSTSCHPPHTKSALPYSQALRYRRIISDPTILTQELHTLEKSFCHRGYSPKDIKPQFQKALHIPRDQTLKHKEARNTTRKPVLVLPFQDRKSVV